LRRSRFVYLFRTRGGYLAFSALTPLVGSFNFRREGKMVSVQMLRDSDLFGELSDEKVEQIARLCREEVYPGRATILQEDEEAQTLYILQDGLVTIRIRSTAHEGGLMVDAANERGKTFGWSALMEPRRYTASAVCLGEVKVLAIEGAELMKLLEEDLQLGFMVMKKVAGIISSRLRNTRSQLRSARTEGLITHG
jgi:CRP/FNR family cyclic AMP-dependent transcriptional regulator